MRYISDKKNFGLKHCSKMKDATLSEILRQSRIKPRKQFMMLSDYSWQDYPIKGRSTGSHIVFYQGLSTNQCKHVPGIVFQSSDESEYISAWTAGIDLAHFIIINNELINKYPYVVTWQASIIILDSKSAVFMYNSGKEIKHTRKITRMRHFVRSGKECNMRKRCERGLKLSVNLNQ